MFNDTNRIGVDKATKKKIVDQIRLHNPSTYMDHPDVPVMFSNVTNWRPKPFMHILTFLDTLEDGHEPQYHKAAFAEAQTEWDFQDYEALDLALKDKVYYWIERRKIKMK